MVKPLKHRKNSLFCAYCKEIRAGMEIYFEVEYPTTIEREIMICCFRCKPNIVKKMKELREFTIHQIQADSRVFVGQLKCRILTVIRSNGKFF